MIASDKTEILIISFIIVCISIIIFDIYQIYVIRSRDRKVDRLSKNLDIITVLINNPNKLKDEANILAFERCLDSELIINSDSYYSHLTQATPVMADLICDTSYDDYIIKSYMVYLAAKYNLFYKTNNEKLKDELLFMITDKDVYVRENALSCIYSIGEANFVYTALKTIDNSDIHHNEKLLYDGLLRYKGDVSELTDLLISEFKDFSFRMQLMLSNYFRFSTSKYVEYAYEVLKDKYADRELKLSALRYLQKYKYDPAYSTIIDYAKNKSEFWEYRAIAASCLGNYPCQQTIELLKELTTDPEWYVRKNAAESLARLNIDKSLLQDILSGNDQYAKEQAQYVIDKKENSFSEVVSK